MSHGRRIRESLRHTTCACDVMGLRRDKQMSTTTLTLTAGGVAATVELLGADPGSYSPTRGYSHNQYRWSIWAVADPPETIATADDLRSPVSDGLCDAMRALMSFLGAWDEAAAGGENADLFPASMRKVDVDWQAWALDVEGSLFGEEES